MSYEAVLYFAGPKTLWSQKVDASEVIMRWASRSRWLATRVARSTHRQLDPSRCGYVVLKDGDVIEHVKPVLPKPPTIAELLAR